MPLFYPLARPYPEERVAGHFPKMTIRVGKVAGVAAPVGGLARLDPLCAGFLSLGEKLVNLLWAFHIVCHRHTTKTLACCFNASISGKVVMTEQPQPGAVQYKECHWRIVGHGSAGQAQALMLVGGVHTELGDLEAGLRYLLEAKAAYESIGSDDGLAWVLNNLAVCYSRRSEPGNERPFN